MPFLKLYFYCNVCLRKLIIIVVKVAHVNNYGRFMSLKLSRILSHDIFKHQLNLPYAPTSAMRRDEHMFKTHYRLQSQLSYWFEMSL